MKLSIIIPVYNEEKTIYALIDKVKLLKIPQVEIEIVVVDDGSTDNTVKKISTKGINLIKHKINQGKGAAVKTGINASTGDYVIIQDADLEYDPKQIKVLMEPILSGKAKVVYGTRLNRMPHFNNEERKLRFVIHYFGNRLLSAITSLLYGSWITDMETCYKLFPLKAVKKFNLNAKRFDFEPEITAKLLKSGYKILEVPIITKPRDYSEGKKLRTFHDGSIALYTLIKYRLTN